MSTDAESRDRPAARTDLWQLPEILEVKATRVAYQTPRVEYQGTRRVEHREAVELLVHTAAPLPARALSPALRIGDAWVSEYETAGHNLYRFFAYAYEHLEEGAPIHLEWPRPDGTAAASSIRFRLDDKKRK